MSAVERVDAGFRRDAYVPGIVTEFLHKSRDADVLVEFVQNELDAGSRLTTFIFREDEISCAGDGAPVTADGWTRLRTVVGAGGRRVPPKVGGIGAKNHGLRTGFRIANDIEVESGGRRARLTLLGPDAEGEEIDPGCWPLEGEPQPDGRGTTIRLPLRKTPLLVRGSDRLTLSALAPADVERYFREAVRTAPERFIGAIAPVIRPRWTLVLRWEDEEVRLVFEAGAVRNGMFERTCTLDGGVDPRVLVRERVRPFTLLPRSRWTDRIPDYFVRDGVVVGEISWPVDAKGRPTPSSGRLRYPIAYPLGEGSRAGSGFSVSLPFVSDDTRYAPARGASQNEPLLARAREAFVTEALPPLLGRHGSRALQLLRDPAEPDPEVEQELLAMALTKGALMVASGDGETPLASAKSRGEVSVPVSGRTGMERVDKRLAFLIGRGAVVLSSGTPSFVVQSLMLLPSDGRYALNWIRPVALIDNLAQERRGVLTARTLAHLKAVLRLAHTLVEDHSLGPEQLKRLVDSGRLPTRAGGWTTWRAARWLDDELPTVPGATDPAVIPPELNDEPLLRSGVTRIKPFDLDEHLQGATFERAGVGDRRRFFGWLQKSWSELLQTTLIDLGAQPIWPADDGRFVPLDGLCLPLSERTEAILTGHLHLPSIAMRRFKGLKLGSRAKLKLRRRPNRTELADWYAAQRERLSQASDSERAIVSEQLDEALDALFRAPDVGSELLSLLDSHVTASRAGTLAPVSALHLDTEAVQRCVLLLNALLPSGRRKLYEALGARTKASADALISALEADPRLDQVFYDRLQAFRRLDCRLDELGDREIIPLPTGVRRPEDLKLRTLRIAERDLWGAWRDEFAPPDPTPRRTDLIVRLGVAPNELTAALSKAFFGWLSEQSSSVIYDQLRQVLRHWVDPTRGPYAWWSRTETNLRCLPVRHAGGRFRLVSWAEVERSKGRILLPDFPALAHQVGERDAQTALAIVTVDGVQGSILQALRACPELQSLRAEVGAPIRVKTPLLRREDERLLSILRRMHSGRVGELLPKNLELFEVAADELRTNWRSLLGQIASVEITDKLTADFRLRRTTYTVPVTAVVDPSSKTLFVDAQIDPVRGLYEGVAGYILRRPSSIAWAALQQAAESEFVDLRYEGPRGGAVPESARAGGTEPETGNDLKAGHHARKVKDQLPDPNPFSSTPIDPKGEKRRRGGPGKRKSPASRAPSPRDTISEEAEKVDLRERHYAHHCQMCLGRFQPAQAAPEGTYLFKAGYRDGLLEAHHVDHIQNDIRLGARNLLLLCAYHHDEIGDLLTGGAVRAALRSAQPLARRFDADGQSRKLVGLLAKVTADAEGGVVLLFFTNEHAKSWLDGF